jgi:hypothetical protein
MVAGNDEQRRGKPIEESTRLEELIGSSSLCQITTDHHQIRQEVVSLADHDLRQILAQRRTKVQIGQMKQSDNQTGFSDRLDADHFWDPGLEDPLDAKGERHLRHGTTPASALQFHLHHAIYDIYQLYVAAVSLQRRTHFIQHVDNLLLQIVVFFLF